jgi:tetratricopeptide (TPR) repeat protein
MAQAWRNRKHLFIAVLLGLATVAFAQPGDRTAETELTRAIEACGKCPDLPALLNNLGGLYHTQGRYKLAAPLYEKALGLREAEGGMTALALLPPLNNLALLYRDTADYKRAREFAERAVSIVQLTRASESAEGAASYANLGAILEVQGQTREAEERLEHALAIREKLFGPIDISVADTLSDLALAKRLEGRIGAAIQLYRRALSIYEQPFRQSRNFATTLNNLAQALVQNGDLKEAEVFFHRAIAEAERQFGPEHPNVAAALTNLASLQLSRRRFKAAEDLLSRAEAIDRQSFPAAHPRIAHDLRLEASLAFERKRYSAAEKLLDEASSILTERLPATHPDLGILAAELGNVYLKEGRRDEAEAAFARAVAILEQAWGRDDPRLVPTLEPYAQLLRAHENYAAAAGIDARIMKIRVTQALKQAA